MLFGILAAGTNVSHRSVLLKSNAVFEQRLSSQSNNEFYLTNYGVYGHNISNGSAGWYWPRSSGKAYIYAQSIWFGAKKKLVNDTLKIVSVGYNPNSGSSWFVPGSVVDGGRVLSEADPKASKYYLYVGSDFSKEGKNIKTPTLPDWPIRWKQSEKVPGKNGYYGDYVSDPAERASYPAVFISHEDMFCIYKDSDTLRNTEYKPNTGYPLGLDILQTIYSWSSGPQKDFVFLSYTIINRSDDTLRECFLAPSGDPDIGNSTNDHNAFYNTDPALNLGFQFTENEAGYTGVIGFDFLESPIIKNSADSILFFQHTGRMKNIGEQIGLTTFRNWVIQNDPTNGPSRYDFMAAGVRDHDLGPGDKRMLMATGPFTMYPQDTSHVVLCILLAPGKGNPIDGDIETNGYLDSLVSLDTYAQSIYDNGFIVTSVGSTLLNPLQYLLRQNFPNPFNPSTEIKYFIGGRSNLTLKIYNVLGQVVATLADGTFDAGEYTAVWDGKNDVGMPVGSGVYFYRLETETFKESRKMLLLR